MVMDDIYRPRHLLLRSFRPRISLGTFNIIISMPSVANCVWIMLDLNLHTVKLGKTLPFQRFLTTANSTDSETYILTCTYISYRFVKIFSNIHIIHNKYTQAYIHMYIVQSHTWHSMLVRMHTNIHTDVWTGRLQERNVGIILKLTIESLVTVYKCNVAFETMSLIIRLWMSTCPRETTGGDCLQLHEHQSCTEVLIDDLSFFQNSNIS